MTQINKDDTDEIDQYRDQPQKIPMSVVMELKQKASPAVCNIICKNGVSGVGVFYTLKCENETLTLFGTCQHVLSIEKCFKQRDRIKFYYRM